MEQTSPFFPADWHITAIRMKARPAFSNASSGRPFNHPSQKN
jgi:hypothetical protein